MSQLVISATEICRRMGWRTILLERHGQGRKRTWMTGVTSMMTSIGTGSARCLEPAGFCYAARFRTAKAPRVSPMRKMTVPI